MSRTELKTKAEQYVRMAAKATAKSDRDVLLKKARNYYADLGLTGMVRWCERHIS
jgi:hypothetical protein